MAQAQRASQNVASPVQWIAFLTIILISAALIGLIWILSARAIDDATADIRTRTEQQVSSIAFVTAREMQRELINVDQSLAIIQEAWKKDSGQVDLGAWRKQSLALTAAADDIFIANERRIIVQGTLPQSVGQGFGSAYVSYPNGSLELFEPDGTKVTPGRNTVTGLEGPKIPAKQFLMFVMRPLDRPAGFWVGATFRTEMITQFFAGAKLGPGGVVGMIDLQRGVVQALAGDSARNSDLDIARSELVQQMRKAEAGVWTGAMPTDKVTRIVAWQRVPGRPMAVVAGIGLDTASLALTTLTAWAYGLAAIGSLVVAVIAGILVWSIATARMTKMRERAREYAEQSLANTRHELELATVRGQLNAVEAGTLISSRVDGVARLDAELRLRQWNQRFAELAGVSLDEQSRGTLVDDFLRYQAQAGVFGDEESAEHGLAARITVFQTGGHAAMPLTQLGPTGEKIAMLVRPVVDGGYMIILAGPENAGFGAMPALESETEDESV